MAVNGDSKNILTGAALHHYPPSAELVPDTYENNINNTDIYLCELFSSTMEFDDDIASFKDALIHCGYGERKIKTKNFKEEEEIKTFLAEMETYDFSFSNAVLIFWFGEGSANGTFDKFGTNNIRDLWKPFVSNVHLMEKPKLFMFFTYVPLENKVMETDTIPMPHEYDSPQEADVLIVIQKTDLNTVIKSQDPKQTYVKELSALIKRLREIHHVTNIVCLPEVSTPIIISTLTRKFYLKESKFRGMQHQLDEAAATIEELLKHRN